MGGGVLMGKTERGFPTADASTVFSFWPTLSVSLWVCVCVCVFGFWPRTTLWALLLCFSCFSFLVFGFFFRLGKVIFLNYRKMFTLLLVLRLLVYIFRVAPDKVRIPQNNP